MYDSLTTDRRDGLVLAINNYSRWTGHPETFLNNYHSIYTSLSADNQTAFLTAVSPARNAIDFVNQYHSIYTSLSADNQATFLALTKRPLFGVLSDFVNNYHAIYTSLSDQNQAAFLAAVGRCHGNLNFARAYRPLQPVLTRYGAETTFLDAASSANNASLFLDRYERIYNALLADAQPAFVDTIHRYALKDAGNTEAFVEGYFRVHENVYNLKKSCVDMALFAQALAKVNPADMPNFLEQFTQRYHEVGRVLLVSTNDHVEYSQRFARLYLGLSNPEDQATFFNELSSSDNPVAFLKQYNMPGPNDFKSIEQVAP